MPIELETVASRPFMRHGSPIDACSRSAKIAASSALGSAQTSIRNSSPPRWATRSSGPREALQPRRDLAQHEVADVVAERLVDRLEAVEVDEQDGQLRALAVRLLHRLGEHAVEHQPVRQAGQAVAEAGALQLGLGAPQRPPQAAPRAPRRAGRRAGSRPSRSRRTGSASSRRAARRWPSRSARRGRRRRAPAAACATRLTPKTSADVVCQPRVAGLVRSPPRKNAPSAIMQPPAAPANAATNGSSCQSMPGCRPIGASDEGMRADGADAEREGAEADPRTASRRGR